MRDLAKRTLNRLLIIDEQKIALRLRETHVRLQTSTGEDRLPYLTGKRPNVSAAAEEAGELSTFVTEKRGERNAWKILFLRHLDAGTGGDQTILGGSYVRTAFDQIRRQPGRHCWWHLMLRQTEPSCDSGGVFAGEIAEEVLRLRYS